ncbi:MAG TPA: transposase, partial [Phycisphaerae bacterium]|nr:transposase [Phycisphaerae bacterium]HNU45798.1 transposase [Phycisphaerae bacterium]
MFEPTFNRAIKLRQADPRITSDAGALLLREADHRLGLTADLAAQLTDPRRPDRIHYLQVELLRQHLYALALGYAHQDDQDALAHDVAMKLSVWDRPGRSLKEGDEFAVELGWYQAAEWTRPYRVVLVVIDLPDPQTGLRELFPHYFVLVTNWRIEQRSGWELVEHYRRRGTFEDRLGEF